MNALTWTLAIGAVVATIAIAIYGTRSVTRPRTGVLVRYTRHACERMAERDIHRAQVEAVLAAPDRSRTCPNSVRLDKDFGERILKVWVAEPEPDTREIVVKSTAWQYYRAVRIPARAVGRVIGRKGATIESIRLSTGAHVVLKAEGNVRISADDMHSVQLAHDKIRALAPDRLQSSS